MKKIVSIIITISMLLASVPAFAISGTGTESNPYLISSASDIAKIHNDLSGYYKLTGNINMTGVTFEPIGNENEGAFTGTIDGAGYTISNLAIIEPDSKYVGFIGCLEGTVKNLNIVNVEACGYRYVGGLVGYAEEGSEVSYCSVDGYASGNYLLNSPYIGGVVGYNKGSIHHCDSYGEYNGTHSGQTRFYLGGIAGYSTNVIEDCNNYSSLISSNYITNGGIVGYSNGIVNSCNNFGVISCSGSSSATGGIAGYGKNIMMCCNYGNVFGGTGGNWDYGADTGGICGQSGTISRCINYGTIDTPGGDGYETFVGGICGEANGGTISECVNQGYIAASADEGGIIGTSVAQSSSAFMIKDCINFDNNIVGYATHGGDLGTRRYVNVSNSINLSNDTCIVDGTNAKTISNVYVWKENGAVDELSQDFYLDYNQLTKQSSYENFDFSDTWVVNSAINSGIPQIKNLPAHIELNHSIALLDVGETIKLSAYIGGISEDVTWSTNSKTLSVTSNGTVTALQTGSGIVTATNSDGMISNCFIRVIKPATNLSLSESSLTINADKSQTLNVLINPSDSYEEIIWSSDNQSVATVSQSGVVTGKKQGHATISCTTSVTGIVQYCNVNVVGNPIANISLTSTKTMNVGEKSSLTATVTPKEYVGTLKWTSSNEDILLVDDNGALSAISPGTAVVLVESDTGKTAQCTVTVKSPSTSISLDKNEITLPVGYTEKLSASILPANTTDTISWSSSSSTYATVANDGTVTAKKAGTATITASTTSGKKAYCIVKVVSPVVTVASVTLDKTEHIMTKADIAQLKASVLPANATNQNLTWVSSDESVATVNSTGVVTAVDAGVAIISATANNGVYHECVIKVISASGSSVILSDAKASPDGTVQVKASLVKNPGISGYKFTVNYDESILTPMAVTPNSEFGGSITTNLDDDNRVGLNIVWYANEDIDINGELFTIDFKVSDSAEYGDTSSVSIEYGARDICNIAGEYFALYIDDANISIEEPIPGDIYEDSEVTIYDLTLLSRYITSLETFTERQKEAADVNNDDLVNVLDVIKMAQYLTGWSGVQLMSLDLFSVDEPAAPVISVGSASVNAANEAEIPVYIKGNTGIAAYRFVLDYNAEDIEILSITPSEFIIKENFNHNLGAESQAEDGLIVTSRTSGGNMTGDGVLFTIKVRYKNPTDTSVSPISIRDIFDNMGNEDGNYVTATYETGYVLGSDYIVANKVVGNTNFSCELYFDDSYAEQSAKAIIAFYDGDGRMVQLMPKDITVKPGKVDLSIDYDKKAYATYKLMIWEGMNSLKPITDVK